MKKLFSLLISLILTFSLSSALIACKPDGEGVEPIYSTEYVYNETHHWLPSTNTSDVKDKEEHVNNSGKCIVCDYYWDCPNLMYQKVYKNNVLGYEVYGYDDYINPQYLNVKIPDFYQGEDDSEPLPVISIGEYAFCGNLENEDNHYCSVKIKSIRMPNSICYIGRNAFDHSDIDELIIPDAVTNDLEYTAMYCSSLKRVVVGDGVTLISKYAFCNSNLLEEIILGSSVREIRQRNFIGNPQLKRIVLPASLVSIPESSYKGNAAGLEPQINLFKNSGSPDIFLEITKEQLEALIIPQKTRDLTGKIIAPSSSALTTYGYVDGWSGSSKIYYVGEWHYEDGKPVPDVQK